MKKKEKEEFKLKICKGRLGLNGGYSSKKLVKDGSGKRRKPQGKPSNHGNLFIKGLKWNHKYCLEESRSSAMATF